MDACGSPSDADRPCLSPTRLVEIDTSGQLADVLALPEHLRDARRRIASDD